MRTFFFLFFSQMAWAVEPALLIQETGKAAFSNYTTGESECVSEFKIQMPLITYKTCDTGKEVTVLPTQSVSFEKNIQSKKSSIERIRNENVIYWVKDSKLELLYTTRLAFSRKDSSEVNWLVVKRDENKIPYLYDSQKKSVNVQKFKVDREKGPSFEPFSISFEDGVLLYQRTDVSLAQIPDVINFTDVQSECMNRVSQFTSSHTEYRRVAIQAGIENKAEVRREAELCPDFLKKTFTKLEEPKADNVQVALTVESPKVEPAKEEVSATIEEVIEAHTPEVVLAPLSPIKEGSISTAVVPVSEAQIGGFPINGNLMISKADWIDQKTGVHTEVADVQVSPGVISYKDIASSKTVKKTGREIAGKLSFASESATQGKENLKTELPSANSYLEISSDGKLIQRQHTRIGLVSQKAGKVTWVDVAASDVPFVYDAKRSELLTRIDDNGTFKNVRIPFSGIVLWENSDSKIASAAGIGPLEGVFADCNQSRTIASDSNEASARYLWASQVSSVSQSKTQESAKGACQKYFKGKTEKSFIFNDQQELKKMRGFKDSDFELLKSAPNEKETNEVKPVAIEVMNDWGDQVVVSQSAAVVQTGEAKKKECQDAVVLALIEFLKKDEYRFLLNDEFEITTLKTARMVSKSKAGRTFLENMVDEKMAAMKKDSKYADFKAELEKLYSHWGKSGDLAKTAAQGLIARLEAAKHQYYKPNEFRLNNEDVSAFLLAYKTVNPAEGKDDKYAIKDIDVAASWVMGQLTEAQMKNRYSRPSNLKEISVRTAHMNGLKFKEGHNKGVSDSEKEKRIDKLTAGLIDKLDQLSAKIMLDSTVSGKCKDIQGVTCSPSSGGLLKGGLTAEFLQESFGNAIVYLKTCGLDGAVPCPDGVPVGTKVETTTVETKTTTPVETKTTTPVETKTTTPVETKTTTPVETKTTTPVETKTTTPVETKTTTPVETKTTTPVETKTTTPVETKTTTPVETKTTTPVETKTTTPVETKTTVASTTATFTIYVPPCVPPEDKMPKECKKNELGLFTVTAGEVAVAADQATQK